jgi:cell shape-determining protein MreC
MDKDELEWLVAKVDTMVEDLKAARRRNEEMLTDKKKLEAKVSSLEKQIRRTQEEGGRVAELAAQNKEYRKKCALLKSKVSSMLAKVDVLQ